MLLIKYISFKNNNDEIIKDVTVPFDINSRNINTIGPMVSDHGTLFKNVSLIEDCYGTIYKVVGNYKKLIEMKDKQQYNKIGY